MKSLTRKLVGSMMSEEVEILKELEVADYPKEMVSFRNKRINALIHIGSFKDCEYIKKKKNRSIDNTKFQHRDFYLGLDQSHSCYQEAIYR